MRDYLETWVDAMVSEDYDALMSALADDATLWIGGRTFQGKEAILEQTKSYSPRFDMAAGSYEILSVLADGDMVVVEMDVEMRTRDAEGNNGRIHNHPVHVFEVRSGRIHAQREYIDTWPFVEAARRL